MNKKRPPLVLCPKCNRQGFVTLRWVRSSYYPKYATIEYNIISGNRYWGEGIERGGLKPADYLKGSNKEDYYKTVSRRYPHYYIGHYDKEKYKQQMIKYRNGKLKSRPNGRKWCHLSIRPYALRQDIREYYLSKYLDIL
jgi:hypothetical protein